MRFPFTPKKLRYAGIKTFYNDIESVLVDAAEAIRAKVGLGGAHPSTKNNLGEKYSALRALSRAIVTKV
jgi:hypothetical protein